MPTYVMSGTPPPIQQSITVWWSDWSAEGWSYMNGGVGAILLILVLVSVVCCLAAAAPPMEGGGGGYYYAPRCVPSQCRGEYARVDPHV